MKVLVFINLMFSTFFLWLFYQRYYKYRDLFENGRYFDGEQVYLDNNVIYIIPAILFLIIALLICLPNMVIKNKKKLIVLKDQLQ